MEKIGADGKGTGMYLTINQQDAYAPKKTGVHNVGLSKLLEGDDRNWQQWFYNEPTGALHAKPFPAKVLFEGANKNLIVFANRNMKNQKFNFDEINETWQNRFTKNSLTLSGSTNIVTGPFNNLPAQKFGFKYCADLE